MLNDDWKTWPKPTDQQIQDCLDNFKYWDSNGWQWAMSHVTHLFDEVKRLREKCKLPDGMEGDLL